MKLLNSKKDKMITDFNISDVTFEKLPKNKEVMFIMYGKIFQFNHNFSINAIFKDGERNYYMALLPLKAISAFPLGMIFKNQKLRSVQHSLRIMNIQLNLEKKKHEVYKISDIPDLKKILSSIPNIISGYNVERQIMDQKVFRFVDNSGINVIFPHYEIARWYYLKSSSMTRQVLASNLEGLYEEINYLDKDKEKARMTLKYGASNGDAAEIARFALDEFSNIMFENFSLDLSASIYEDKNKRFKSMSLLANFPIHGVTNFKVRGFVFNSTLFIYHIMEEDSGYPFEELEVLREISINSSRIRKVAQIKKKRVHARPKAKDTKPNSEFENVQIVKDSEEFSLIELRRGLESKKTEFVNILVDNKNDPPDLDKKLEDSDTVVDISFNDNDAKGDYSTVRAELIEDNDNNDLLRRSKIIEYFIRMLFSLQEIENKKEKPRDISVIQNEFLLPQKDPLSNDRKRWLKSTLSDRKTRRKYLVAHIVIESENYYAIEVEKDMELDGLSTLLLKDRNNEHILKSGIREIMKNFVKKNGKWENNYSDVMHLTLVHPKESENGEYSNEDMISWAKRLLDKFSEFNVQGE